MFKKTFGYLAKKLNKTQDQLLMNRIEEQLLPNEFGELMDYHLANEETAAQFHCIHSLRKTKDNNDSKNSCVNVDAIYNPNWFRIGEMRSIKALMSYSNYDFQILFFKRLSE